MQLFEALVFADLRVRPVPRLLRPDDGDVQLLPLVPGEGGEVARAGGAEHAATHHHHVMLVRHHRYICLSHSSLFNITRLVALISRLFTILLFRPSQ